MPAAYAHLLITDKALERFRDEQGVDEKLCGSALTHSHFAYLGSLSPDYPYLDILQPRQKVGRPYALQPYGRCHW